MVYKIGTTNDLENIAITDSEALRVIRHYAEILTTAYGADRNIDTDDGGYVLYATPETSEDEIKSFFDFSRYIAESVEIRQKVFSAVFILSSDYGVVLVMSTTDTPPEFLLKIKKNMEE